MAAKKASPNKPPADVVKDAKAQAMAQLETDRTADTAAGAQAGLFDKVDFKKLVDKVLPALLEGAMIASGGPLTPAKVGQIVGLVVKIIPGLIAPADEAQEPRVA